MGEIDVLEIRVEKLEEAVKDLREDAKSDRKILISAINELKENSIKISMFMEGTNKKMDDTEKKIDRLSNKIDEFSNTPKDTDRTWYQNTISTYGKWIFYIALIVLCVTLGIKLDDAIGLIGK